ncbi:MAG TPA: 3-dehydro-L-gulonate 2-dehydrogenase [Segetibacter sp.]
MTVPYNELKAGFKRVLIDKSFSEEKAELCATIFADNSRDGVYSHGLNRFPVFIKVVEEGLVDIHAEPELVERNGVIEKWEGHSAPGMYNATKAMERAIELAKANGIGCVAIKNTNHWMRGGTYGWQAANAGCIGICFTNTIANMPPWGGKEPRLGNNPLVISVPRQNGHIVLDMAMSQFSYGKLQENELNDKNLPVPGGYDENGKLSVDPAAISKTQRALPIGFWKGSGLSFILDVLLSVMTGGKSVKDITGGGSEADVSQFFLCINPKQYNEKIIEEIIEYTKSSEPADADGSIRYPGEHALNTRLKSESEGVLVDESIWNELLKM